MKILTLLVLLGITSSEKIMEPKISLEWYRKLDIEPEYDHSTWGADPEFRTQMIFKNDFISKNGSDYILSENVSSVEFSCKADYPIRWTVPFPEQLLQTGPFLVNTIELRSSSLSSTGNPKNIGFENVLRITYLESDDEFFSANFTCESIDQRRQNSIYIFRQCKHVTVNQEEMHYLLVHPKDEYSILPCRPAVPHLTVILEKQISNGTFEKVHVSAPKLGFDPKHGFKFSKDLFGDNIYGIYRCRMENDTKAFIYVNITEQVMSDREGAQVTEFKAFSRNKGDAIVYKDDGDKHVWCCSGVPGAPPVTMMEACKWNSGDCGIRKQMFLEKLKYIDGYGESRRSADFALVNERDDCSEILLWSFSNAFVYCKGGDLEYMDNYVYRFRPHIQNITKRTEDLDYRTKHLMNYDSADIVSSLPVDRKVFVAVGKAYENTTKQNEEEDDDDDGDDEHEFFDYECLRRARSLNDTSKPNPPHIQEFDRNHYFDGELLTFACFAVEAIYSGGIQLRLNWKNGSALVLPTRNSSTVYMYFSGAGGSKHDTVSINDPTLVNHRFGQEIRADLEMESVECFAPVGNSENWDVLKYTLDIRPNTTVKVKG